MLAVRFKLPAACRYHVIGISQFSIQTTYLCLWIEYEASMKSIGHLSDKFFSNTILQKLLGINLNIKQSQPDHYKLASTDNSDEEFVVDNVIRQRHIAEIKPQLK